MRGFKRCTVRIGDSLLPSHYTNTCGHRRRVGMTGSFVSMDVGRLWTVFSEALSTRRMPWSRDQVELAWVICLVETV